MKTIETIQKTFNVFKTLSRIAMILSFVWAGIIFVGVIFGIVLQAGGNIEGLPLEYIMDMTQSKTILEMIGMWLGDFVLAITKGILFLFAYRYFKQEVEDGTPFTMAGADQVKNLGIMTIVMPLIAIIIAAIIYTCFDIDRMGNWDNGSAVVLGIALILFSLILRHGAEVEENPHWTMCSGIKNASHFPKY